jgi:cytochrome c
MSRLLTAAAYAMHNMPLGTAFSAPVLVDDDAYDVAAYVISQKRPEKADLEKDFPVRLQKPVDTPLRPVRRRFRTGAAQIRSVRADPRQSAGTGRGVPDGEGR